MITATVRGDREYHMNIVDKPPINGDLVHFIASLFPGAMDFVLRKTYNFKEGEGIKDAIEAKPI